VIMEDIDFAIGILDKLHKSGIQICIDDFGTGYSSLSYLFRLPVNALKIDRSFISRLDNGESAEIVHTIIDLAHNLSVDVIAEGVETETQWKILKQLGCDYCQGYLISHPMDGSEVEKFFLNYQNGIADLK
jgi:diguanylate cyclase